MAWNPGERTNDYGIGISAVLQRTCPSGNRGEKKPLTVDEIWAVAEQTGLVPQLQTSGKTPTATLGARLYTDANSPDGLFRRLALARRGSS